MIYKTFEEWKAGQWLEDGEPRTKAYTKDELLLIELGWQYGFDAGKETKELTDEDRSMLIRTLKWAEDLLRVAGHDEAVSDVQDCLMILRKAQYK